MAETQGNTLSRHFYRCTDCLSVIVTEGQAELRCTCGGTYEHMGRVQSTVLVVDFQRAPCDERCTHAKGPKCDCQCTGKNHGTGRLIDSTAITAESIPTVTPPDQRAMERADAYRAAKSAARERIDARYGAVLRAKAAGQWIPEWSRFLDARHALDAWRKACAMRTHTLRLKTLAAVAA